MELSGKEAEWSNARLEVGNETGIEIEEADEGVKGLAAGREGPLADEVEFGRGRAVAVGAKVESNPFDAVKKEITFLGVEGEAPFCKNVADAGKVQDKGVWFI